MPAFVQLRAKPARKRKHATAASVREHETQPGLVRWLRMVLPPGSAVAAVLNEAVGIRSSDPHARARYIASRKMQGLVVGWPDLILALPHSEVCWIETKRPVGGVLSAAQQEVHAQLRALGHSVGVATGPESALALLREWGVPLRLVGDLAAAPARVRLAKPRAGIDAPRLPI